MMDRLPPIYSAIASQQAKFEAENMDNLKVLMRVNEMQQQRERQMAMAGMAGLIPPSLHPRGLGGPLLPPRPQTAAAASLLEYQRRHGILPPTSAAATHESIIREVSPTLTSSMTEAQRIKNILNLEFPETASTSFRQPPVLSAAELQLASNSAAVAAAATAVGGDLLSERHSQNLSDIRTEKVQEALKSGHQRGRKRCDLNEQERLELTRTRNREHARSTRLRKKARHDELLRTEARLKPLLYAKQLACDREECVQRFLTARQGMLNTTDVESKSEDALKDMFKDVVAEDFKFEAASATGDIGESSSNSSDNFEESMKTWDQNIRTRVSQSDLVKETSITTFAYEIQDGDKGIAINDGGIGYAQINLVLYQTNDKAPPTSNPIAASPTTKRTVLLTALLRAKFEEEESRLSQLSWTSLSQHIPESTDKNSSPLEALMVAAEQKSELIV